MRAGGLCNLRGSKWLHGFDWTGLEDMTLAPSYKPILKSRLDIARCSHQQAAEPVAVEGQEKTKADDTWEVDFAT